MKESRARANKKWNVANAGRYEHIHLLLHEGENELFDALSKSAGYKSKSEYIRRCVYAQAGLPFPEKTQS